MANRHMKRCSPLLIIRELQIKASCNTNSCLLFVTNNKCWGGSNPSHCLCGNVNWCGHCGKQYRGFSKELKILSTVSEIPRPPWTLGDTHSPAPTPAFGWERESREGVPFVIPVQLTLQRPSWGRGWGSNLENGGLGQMMLLGPPASAQTKTRGLGREKRDPPFF